MAKSSKNRRQAPRANAWKMIAYASFANQRAVWIVGNISAGGMFARTEKILPVGSRVHVQLMRSGLPGGLVLTGRVVLSLDPEAAHKKKAVPGMGIEWEDLSEEDHSRLAELFKEISEPKKNHSGPFAAFLLKDDLTPKEPLPTGTTPESAFDIRMDAGPEEGSRAAKILEEIQLLESEIELRSRRIEALRAELLNLESSEESA